MNVRQYVALGLIAISIVAGCRSVRGQHAYRPASIEVLNQIRAHYASVDPNALVGRVVATLPQNGLIAVGDMPLDQFKIGDTLVIIDTKQKIVAAGKVVRMTDNALHLSYDVAPSGRDPRLGDLAVRAAIDTKPQE